MLSNFVLKFSECSLNRKVVWPVKRQQGYNKVVFPCKELNLAKHKGPRLVRGMLNGEKCRGMRQKKPNRFAGHDLCPFRECGSCLGQRRSCGWVCCDITHRGRDGSELELKPLHPFSVFWHQPWFLFLWYHEACTRFPQKWFCCLRWQEECSVNHGPHQWPPLGCR